MCLGSGISAVTCNIGLNVEKQAQPNSTNIEPSISRLVSGARQSFWEVGGRIRCSGPRINTTEGSPELQHLGINVVKGVPRARLGTQVRRGEARYQKSTSKALRRGALSEALASRA
nr:hypothetical protein CFP56_46056 [Quercus suber]